MRVVLDANVFLSALIKPSGPPGLVLAAWAESDAFTLVISAAIAEELQASMLKPKVTSRTGMTSAEVATWIQAVLLRADLVTPEDRIRAVEADPDDDKYLEAAHAGRVAIVVSGDRHLLDLGRHGETVILTPAEFLTILKKKRIERTGQSS